MINSVSKMLIMIQHRTCSAITVAIKSTSAATMDLMLGLLSLPLEIERAAFQSATNFVHDGSLLSNGSAGAGRLVANKTLRFSLPMGCCLRKMKMVRQVLYTRLFEAVFFTGNTWCSVRTCRHCRSEMVLLSLLKHVCGVYYTK